MVFVNSDTENVTSSAQGGLTTLAGTCLRRRVRHREVVAISLLAFPKEGARVLPTRRIRSCGRSPSNWSFIAGGRR